MDLKKKVVDALVQGLKPEFVRLSDDDEISGFIVSPVFMGMSGMDRQSKIDEIFQNAGLTREERRRILMIAALTREEYDAVGPCIRVNKVKQLPGGSLEILLQGGLPDAKYVQRILNNKMGLTMTDPKPVGGAIGVLVSFQAKGSESKPLTKKKALQILKEDRYIEVMANA